MSFEAMGTDSQAFAATRPPEQPLPDAGRMLLGA